MLHLTLSINPSLTANFKLLHKYNGSSSQILSNEGMHIISTHLVVSGVPSDIFGRSISWDPLTHDNA